MKKLVLSLILSCSAFVIGYLFWQNEWKYNLPTPLPAGYNPVNTGEFIDLRRYNDVENHKPVLLHFFNPDCPCSRFNITHFKMLVKKYRRQLTFAVVVLHSVHKHNEAAIRQRFDFSVPVYFDSSLAAACGVYATPQAALLGADHRLYYRGNYNKSRYCTDPKSNYVMMAIDSLLSHVKRPLFSGTATISYGCRLPVCSK